MKKIFKWLIGIVLTVFIIICITSTILLLCTNGKGIITFKNYSLVIAKDSDKTLGIEKNDFLILENIEFKSLKADDVISYTKNTNNELPDVQFGKIFGFGSNSFNNISLVVNNEEGMSIEVSQESYIGKWTNKKIMFLGVIFGFLLTKTGFLVGIILPLFLILIYEIYKIVISYRLDNIEDNNSIDRDDIIDKDTKNVNEVDKDDDKNNKSDEIEI